MVVGLTVLEGRSRSLQPDHGHQLHQGKVRSFRRSATACAGRQP